MTKEQFESLQGCKEGLDWALKQLSLAIAWDTCQRSDWMWWLLHKGQKASKELSVKYSRWCANSVAHLRNYNSVNASASASAAAYAARSKQADYLRTITTNPFTT